MIHVAALLLAVATPAANQGSSAKVDDLLLRAKSSMAIDPARAAVLARAATRAGAALSDPVKRRVSMVTADWLDAEALNRIGDAATASAALNRARTLADAMPGQLSLKGNVLLTSGRVHSTRGEVAAALVDYVSAHRLFVRAGEQRQQAISLIDLAMLYNDGKDYPAALHYLREALDAYPADPGLALSIWNSRGIALQELGRFEEAGNAFRQAIAAARQVGSATTEAQFLRNLARNDLMAGRLRQADAAIAAAAALPGAARDDARQLDAVKAQAALQHHHPDRAGELIGRAFIGLDLATTDLLLRDAHQTAVAVYRALHETDLALAHLQALKRLDDKATKLATETGTALMAARFDSANQEAKIARLRDAERLRQAREALQRARTERVFWLGGAGATAIIIALLLAGVIALRRSRDRVRAANADLAVTNTALGKALAAKTAFLATTSHEIRTPLNGILGMTQVMLADPALAEGTRERLGVVQAAGATMRSLVDDILDVAKMETGHLTIEPAPFDLATCLRDAARLWAEQAQAKGLSLVVDLDRCPYHVEGDAARVRQLAFNLLSNAVKFTQAGSIVLRAELAGAGVRITVVDTGIGIPPDQHEAVFESFKQADTSTTRQYGGTGLGLSIVRSLARAMGGEITLLSAPGIGTTFTVDLPLPTVIVTPQIEACADGETLLVFERNPIARAMLRTLFQPHVAVVAFAGTLDEAGPLLASGSVTRVLVDDATARAGGDAPAFLRALVAAAPTATVSLLWPISAETERGEWLAAGVNQVIVKPVTGAALVTALFDRKTNVNQRPTLVSQAA